MACSTGITGCGSHIMPLTHSLFEMTCHTVGVDFIHQMGDTGDFFVNRDTREQQFLVFMLVDMAELAIFAYKIEMIGSVPVFDYTVTIKAVSLVRYMLVVHEIPVTCGCKQRLAPVMACQSSVRNHISGINLSVTFYHFKVATLTGNPCLLHCLMSNRLLD